MRPFLIAPAALLLLLPGLALAQAQTQTQAECEYRNPDHPGWNFTRPCTVTVDAAAGRTTTVARVSNGSKFTLVETETTDGMRLTINDRASRLHDNGRPGCYLTIKDKETICIHAEYVDPAAVGVAPVPEPAAEPAAPEAPETTPDRAFGGAEPGHCLTWVASDSREGLIGKGPCSRRNDCAEDEGEGGMSCLTDFIWADGRETVVTSQGGVYTLDGAVAVDAGEGCFTDEAEGLHFCFSKAAMTEARYPALAMDPAPVLAPSVAAAPTATGAPVDPVPTVNRCSFLRDAVEVSGWACTATVDCEPPLCTVTYRLENGTNVTLDIADGEVRLMNGAKANAAPWSEGAVVEVTRPGAPYSFRFTPGVAAPAQ